MEGRVGIWVGVGDRGKGEDKGRARVMIGFQVMD